jgi:uncharacterized protein (DUF4415 family)
MKRKKRVKRSGRIAKLRASMDVERVRSFARATVEELDRWRQEMQELARWRKLPKKRVTLNLDADVLAWFRGPGRGYQREINRALRRVMEKEERKGG